MTDERMGNALWTALAALPAGAGIVFRHHATPPAARRVLFDRVRRIARRRRLVLVLAGSARQAIGWRADGVHGRGRNAPGHRMMRTVPVHDMAEIARAIKLRADLVFLSPVFATRSHPGSRVLGRWRFAALAAHTPMPVIALGGMTKTRGHRMTRLGASGWAAIDAWTSAKPDRG